jgi:membrane associated rhomboid family serine protease/Zn-finger nucleic acid-binding protein
MFNLKPLKPHPKINCPDCAVSMMPFLCSTVVVDRCGNCHGIWFDRKELGVFRDSLKDLPLEKIDTEKVKDRHDVHLISTCPRCSLMLNDQTYAYKSKVMLKRCWKCEGMWLPNAEVLKFIDLVKIAKLTEPDLKASLAELKKFEEETNKIKDFNGMVNVLNLRVRYRFPNFFGIIVPLYDDNPKSRRAWVTLSLLIFNLSVGIVVLNYPYRAIVYRGLGLIAENPQLSTFFTSLFLHGDVTHLLGNMFFLWTFGDNVEDVLGPLKFIFFFAFCGIFAGLGHVWFHPVSHLPLIGASGAISGLMGAYLCLFSKVTVKTWINGAIVDLHVGMYLGIWLFFQVVLFLFTMKMSRVGVSFSAHVFGFLSGYLLLWLFKKLNIIKDPSKTEL